MITDQAKARSHFLQCAGVNIHLLERGIPGNDAVIIWHGVSGTCHDHEELADYLAQTYHVICPDSIGCGLSDPPTDPATHAGLLFAAEIARSLVTQLGLDTVRWVGASKGAALGMVLADVMTECPISHLVLNDAGPLLPVAFQRALTQHLSNPPVFDDLAAFRSHIQAQLTRDGLEVDEQKLDRLSETWSRRMNDGRIGYHFSPELAQQYHHNAVHDFDLWPYYRRIRAKTLLIHGEKSRILREEEINCMQSSGPCCQLHIRRGGHSSFFHTREEIELVSGFLAGRLQAGL